VFWTKLADRTPTTVAIRTQPTRTNGRGVMDTLDCYLDCYPVIVIEAAWWQICMLFKIDQKTQNGAQNYVKTDDMQGLYVHFTNMLHYDYGSEFGYAVFY